MKPQLPRNGGALRSFKLRGVTFLLAVEQLQSNAQRINLKVRDPRRPYTISFNIGRYAPNRKRSF